MSTAWVLDFGQGRHAAVAQRQQLHLMHTPAVQALAFAPACAKHVLLWNGRCLPVLDFGVWCQQLPTSSAGLLGVYAYAGADAGAPCFGALWLAAPPVAVRITDAQACELPAERQAWRDFSLSCYRDERFGPIPIIDLAGILDTPSSHRAH